MSNSSPEPQSFRVLVFSKTASYRHASIPAGIAALYRLAKQSSESTAWCPTPFTVTATEDAAVFAADELARYRVIVFLQATGDFLDGDQLRALQGLVRSAR